MQTNKTLFEYAFLGQNGKEKRIRVIHGDLTKIEGADVVVCSAFQGAYTPLPGTLIGSLWIHKGIPVKALARDPEIPYLRDMGAWLSKELISDFKRVACVEFYGRDYPVNDYQQYLIKTGFSTLAYLIQQAEMRNIPVKTIALPVLATGLQDIPYEYVVAPLIKYGMKILTENDGVEMLTFCEIDEEKAKYLAEAWEKAMTSPIKNTQVFISYSTKNSEYAFHVRSKLEKAGFSCWMAPDSIPTGSSYLKEIPLALSTSPVFALILTPDAENSKWVPLELATAIDTKCELIPIQIEEYKMGDEFTFMLKRTQIFPAWQYTIDDAVAKAIQIITDKTK